jgi:hypothetical protein
MSPLVFDDYRRFAGLGSCFVVLLLGVLAGGVVAAEPTATADNRSGAVGETTVGAVDTTDATLLVAPARNDDRVGTWYYETVSFEGAAGQLIEANLSAPGADTVLVLKGPTGETVTVNENGGADRNSRVVARLPRDGEYRFLVTSRNRVNTFEYALSISELDRYEEDPGPIRVGQTVTGSIEESDSSLPRFDGHYDNVTLDAERGQRIAVQLDSPAASSVRIIRPNRERLNVDTQDTRGRTASFLTELPSGGEYTIVVGSKDDDSSFPYRLSVENRDIETVELSREKRYARDRKEYSEFEIGRTTINTTTAYVGTPITVRASVTNTGTVEGDFTGILIADRTRIASTVEDIEPTATETIEITGSLNRSGEHFFFIGPEPIGSVNLLPRPEPELVVSDSDDTTRATLSHGQTNATYEVPLAGSGTTVVDFDRLSVRVDTTTRLLRIDATDRSAPDGTLRESPTASLPTGAYPLGGLHVETARSVPDSAVGALTVDFRVLRYALDGSAGDVELYYAADGSSEWRPAGATLTDETAGSYRFAATVNRSGEFVAVERRPAITVENVSADTATVPVGTNFSVFGDVSNEGLRNGSHEIALTTNGRVMATRTVQLDVNESKRIRFRTALDSPGEYQLRVGNESTPASVTVLDRVTATAVDGPTDVSSAADDPTPTPAPAAETGGTPVSDASGSSDAILVSSTVLLLFSITVAVVGWSRYR